MKTLLLATFVLLLVNVAFSQKWNVPNASDFPSINRGAAKIEQFVPRNWRIIARAAGDLNGDNLSDTVLVIKGQFRRFLYKDEYMTDFFDTNPRILLIIFKEKDGAFRLGESSNSFIIPRDNPSMSEPLQSVRIRKGVLILEFEEWYSAGTWYTALRTYTFKYLRDQFRLIGADKTSSMRNSGEVETRSYNFLTKRIRTTIGSYDEKIKPISSWRNFRVGSLKTFRTFPKAFEWEIEPDYFL